VVLLTRSLIEREGSRDGEVQIRSRPLATGGKSGGVNFVPIYLTHNS